MYVLLCQQVYVLSHLAVNLHTYDIIFTYVHFVFLTAVKSTGFSSNFLKDLVSYFLTNIFT